MTTGHISPLFLSAVMPPAPACRATSRARRDPTGSPAIDESTMSLYVSICLYMSDTTMALSTHRCYYMRCALLM